MDNLPEKKKYVY